ncbi:MAG: hypothetical protein ACT4NV_07360 [Rhodoferax sp.]
MTIDSEISQAVVAAAQHYFAGERREMLLILAGALVSVLLTGGLYLLVRDGFTKALLITVIIAACLLSVSAISLLNRDPKLHDGLVSVSFVLALIACSGVFVSRAAWVHGAAVGLLLVVVAQLAIDHYSQARAERYLGQLHVALSSLFPVQHARTPR